PQNPFHWYNLGCLSFEERNFKKALEYYSKAVALDSTRPAFHGALGRVLFFLGRGGEAAQAFEIASSMDSGNPCYTAFMAIGF
ncbi:MAG: tetratricopeptide repeat protein, partial [Armatimonadetes bacterium]|nr:tetratricopeptide repeat protein [Armatimonadota bacterium]